MRQKTFKCTKGYTTATVMPLLGMTTADGAIGFLRRHNVSCLRIGRRLLWHADAVHRLLASLEQRQAQKGRRGVRR